MSIKLADFSIDNSTPQVTNIRTLAPANLGFYETHGFSVDDKKLIFSGYERGGYFYDMDIYTLDLSTGTVEQLTDNDEWDEHAHYSSDGSRIIWSSSTAIPQKKSTSHVGVLRGPPRLDLWIMNADGSGKRRLTFTNESRSSEGLSSSVGNGFGDGSWSPDDESYMVKLRAGCGTEKTVLLEL